MLAFSLAFPGALITYACYASWWLGPALRKQPSNLALALLCAFHGLRAPFGMTLLAPGIDPSIPQGFREAVAYGDFASAVLALTAAILLQRSHSLGRPVAWIFSVVGMLDLANAIYLGNANDVFSNPLGPAFMAVTLYVPALWVTHVMIVRRLLQR